MIVWSHECPEVKRAPYEKYFYCFCTLSIYKNNKIRLRSFFHKPPKVLNYKPRCNTEGTTAAAKKTRPIIWFSYCTTIVSTTLNPNSPLHTEVRSTLFILISDSWFSHNII